MNFVLFVCLILIMEIISFPFFSSAAGFRFEAFNLDTKLLIGRTHLHEPVSYWTWLNSDIVAIVTDSAVYHWDLWQGESFNIISSVNFLYLRTVYPVWSSVRLLIFLAHNLLPYMAVSSLLI